MDGIWDWLVMGNEPAGLWLLSKLSELREPKGGPLRLLWLRSDSDLKPVLLPKLFAERFKLLTKRVPPIHFHTPRETFAWTEATLRQKFASRPLEMALQRLKTSEEIPVDLARQVLQATPELYAYALGIWRIVGRTAHPLPEAALTWALLHLECVEWHPALLSTSSVEILPCRIYENPILRLQGGTSVQIEVKGFGTLTTKQLVLNLSAFCLRQVFSHSPTLLGKFHLSEIDSVSRAQYFLSLSVEPTALPSALVGYHLYLEDDELPEFEEEIWPVHVQRQDGRTEVVASALAARTLSYEALAERFSEAMARLYRRFPFLAQGIHSIYPPLGGDTCYAAEYQENILKRVGEAAHDLYPFCVLQPQSLLRNVFLLGPFVGSHYAHPCGSLLAAQELLQKQRLIPKEGPPPPSTENAWLPPPGTR